MCAEKGGTISTYDVFALFPDEQAAIEFLIAERWPDGVTCPRCESSRVKRISTQNRFHCNGCGKQFSPRTGTIFEHSRIPLRKWYFAMYLLQTARKGISSVQLSIQLGITQKSAWFMLHRLRTAMAVEREKLSGEVELDETYIGGIERFKHKNKRKRAGRGIAGKQPVLGMRQRDGPVVAKPIKDTTHETMFREMLDTIEKGTKIYTDDHRSYQGTERAFERTVVRQYKGEYEKEGTSTNAIESVWAVVKRGYRGVYHHWNPKNTYRYVDEFTFRLNELNVKIPATVRLKSFVRATVGKRLYYKELTDDPGKQLRHSD